jgi:uncharacterized protein YrrD
MRVSEVIGKTVVSADTGEKLGDVADLLVDAEATRIVGLVIGAGMFSSERVLPYEDVTALGRDAVVARSGRNVVGPRDWHARAAGAERTSALRNRRVITDHGRQLGAVKDIVLEDGSGRVDAYDVSGAAFAGLIERRQVLPHSRAVVIGPDAIVVPEELANAVPEPGR